MTDVTATIQPKEFTCHEVAGVPANLLASGEISLGPAKSWTGYATMTVGHGGGKASDNSLFYWFFQSRNATLANAPENIPVVVWLNGGPGASSLAGLFMENGPLSVASDAAATITADDSSWNRRLHMIYVDQPVGTGFSFTTADDGYVTSEQELREQFCAALEMLFKSDHFSRYRKCPFYIVGESYAGKYIPNIAVELIENRDKYPNTPALSGVAIGDGWMLPGMQTRVQIDFGFAMGFVDTKQYDELFAKCDLLDKLIADQNFLAANKLGNQIMADLESCGGNPDIYDVRTFAQLSTDTLKSYLDSPAVQKAIGVDRQWQIADDQGPVADGLAADIYAPAHDVILTTLKAARDTPLRVLFYTGDFDMSCGFRGTERMLQEFDFPRLGSDAGDGASWRQLDRQVWVRPPAATLGFVKALGNLTQVTVVDAGHLVPMDRPSVSRSMIENWIFERPFPVVSPVIS
jgi:vitellogenic carboxypeptidase-like protein